MDDLLKNRKALLIGAGAIAACLALALILVSVLGSGSGDKKSTPAPTTTVLQNAPEPDGTVKKVPGAAETAALFKGVPQHLNELGNPKAPATMIEFADLQCPFCRAYTLDALPGIVKTYVRTGKMKLVFSGMHFIGPDSEKALRVVYAAGIQGKLWNVLDLLYKNQGKENSSWVTDGLLRSVGASVPGLDTDKMLADANSSDVDGALQFADQQANAGKVNSTPTFFAGPTGGTLQHLNVTALSFDGFKALLDPLAS